MSAISMAQGVKIKIFQDFVQMDCFSAQEADENSDPKSPKPVKTNPFVLPAANKLNVSLLLVLNPKLNFQIKPDQVKIIVGLIQQCR